MNSQKHVPNAVFLCHFTAQNPGSPAEDVEGYGLSDCSGYDPPTVLFIPTFHGMFLGLLNISLDKKHSRAILTSKLHIKT
jgi:hypothetical protein